ncbi:MAG: hypothetical protein IPP33_06310 [Flavobacteriales bacterium]|nr:hypothetical protein [Flavobacteriales bacterium]
MHEHPLKKPLRAFLSKLNVAFEGRTGLEKATDELHAELFSLRLKAIEWLVTQSDTDLLGKLGGLDKELLGKATDASRALLVDNMRFALQAQRDIIVGLERFGHSFDGIKREHLAPLLELHYDQMIAAFATVPNPQAAQLLLRWMSASLRTEMGLLMGDAVLNGEAKVSDARLKQLNALLVHATQNSVPARRSWPYAEHTYRATFLAEPLPKGWIKEQKQVAEAGLGDWFKRS